MPKKLEPDPDLEFFRTEDLVTELKARDYGFVSLDIDIISKMYDEQRDGKDIQHHLDYIYWELLGRIKP